MAMLIAELALSGSRKADGSANAGGRVFLTQIGSQTAVLGYQDRDKLASHTLSNGGILLDSAGKAAIYVDSPCTVRVEDSTGAETASYTAAPVSAAELVEVTNSKFTGVDANGQSVAGARTYLDTVLTNLGVSLGGQDGLYQGAYGSTSRTIAAELDEIYSNAKRFGVVGDGNVDDTSALQAAINAVSGAGGGVVFIPHGTYNISAPVTLPSGVTLRGNGVKSTVLRNTNTGTGCVQVIGNAAHVWVSDLAISHVSSSTAFGIGSTAASLSGMHFRNLSISGHRTGVAGIGAAGGLVVEECLITTTTADAAARGVVIPNGAFFATVRNNAILADIGYPVDFVDSAGVCIGMIVGNLLSSSTRAINLDAVTRAFIAGNSGLSGSVLYVSATCTGIFEAGNTWSGGVTDNGSEGNFFGSANIRPFSGFGYTIDVAAAGNHTPNPWLAHSIRIRATSAGTITVNTPDASFIPKHGHEMVIQFYNASGGAVTWTLDAIYHVVAAPAPANGNITTIRFIYDAVRVIWVQSAGSATVTA